LPLAVALGVALMSTAAVLAACARLQESDRPAAATSPEEHPTTKPGEVGSQWTRPPEGVCDCHENDYQTFHDLAVESTLILIGTVGESRVADVMDRNSGFPTRTIHTTVAVEEVLKASGSSSEIVVSTQELAYGGPGDEDWRQAGTQVLLFLTPNPEDPDNYLPSNLSGYQAAYFVRGEDLEITVASGADVTRLNHRVAAMTLSELRDRIEAIDASPE
jgi:hypothetical protein